MTDQFAALASLANVEADNCAERETALAEFYERWQNESLVVDKWFAVQSASRRPNTLATIKALTAHPAFDLAKPNKVYAVFRTLGANLPNFHSPEGYAYLAEQVRTVDALNPQIASRLARSFDRWKKFDGERQRHAKAALESIRDHAGLSPDVFEVVSRALG